MTITSPKPTFNRIADLVHRLAEHRRLAQENEEAVDALWKAAQAIETEILQATTATALVITMGGTPVVVVLNRTGENPSIAFHSAQIVPNLTTSTDTEAGTGTEPVTKKSSADKAPSAADACPNPDDTAERRHDELIVEARGLATRAAKTVGREQTVALIARIGKAKKLGEVAPALLPELIAALTASLADTGGEL
jgi:hypothetical protein